MATINKLSLKIILLTIGLAVLLILLHPLWQLNQLQQIKQRDALIVATRTGATTYYEGINGPTGIEYQLSQQFADYLGVSLRLITQDDILGALQLVEDGQADLAAAGITITEQRAQQWRFGPVYQTIDEQVVYRRGSLRPRQIEQLGDKPIIVTQGSAHEQQLMRLQHRYPELTWEAVSGATNELILERINDGELAHTIVDSNELALFRRFYPELQIGFTLSEAQPLAWAFAIRKKHHRLYQLLRRLNMDWLASKLSDDNSLLIAADDFFNQLKQSGELNRLLDEFYGHVSEFDYIDTRTLLRRYQSILPKYRPLFIEAAGSDWDWRLLAALGYQESHWNPLARSPTGVRGMMMLTLTTARQMGITNRLDAEQSIRGGADYLRFLKGLIDDDIPEPDKTWFTLASYNIGRGHFEDARRLTAELGGNPNQWVEVKQVLPLLRDEQYHQRTRYGFARGNEAVVFVENIRRYYEILIWLSEQDPD